MRVFTLLLAVACLVFIDTAAIADDPTCENPIGTWINDLDKPSKLVIESIDATTGAMKGKYIEGNAGEFPLVGWVNDKAAASTGDHAKVLSFTVRWGDYGSITSWTGYCRKDKNGIPTLYMQWHLASPNSSFDWDHVNSGLDRFKPYSAAVEKKK